MERAIREHKKKNLAGIDKERNCESCKNLKQASNESFKMCCKWECEWEEEDEK